MAYYSIPSSLAVIGAYDQLKYVDSFELRLNDIRSRLNKLDDIESEIKASSDKPRNNNNKSIETPSFYDIWNEKWMRLLKIGCDNTV